MNAAEKILEYRVKHNLTQEQLAARLQVSTRTVARIETGVCQPRASTLRALGISTEEYRADSVLSQMRAALINAAIDGVADEAKLNNDAFRAALTRIAELLEAEGVTLAELKKVTEE